MKKTIIFYLMCRILFSVLNSTGQVSLPYFSGFDDASQQAGWAEFKTASTQFSHWGYGSFDPFSPPNSVGHDYSPSTGITVTDNWFVSPGFSIVYGGVLDSVRYKFSGFSVPQTGDTIAIYLLNGSQNPASATTKTLLFDFRDAEYITDNTYRIKTNITLPASNGLSYLALRYRNSNCSVNWLTVYFDNIAINGAGAGFDENVPIETQVFPNPSNGVFSLSSSDDLKSMIILTLTGQIVYQATDPENSIFDLSDIPKGVYIAKIQNNNKLFMHKIIIQ